MLSIGAFLQNLEYAANNLGYSCQFNITATNNQDAHVAEVKLSKTGNIIQYDTKKIIKRRTVRSNYLNDILTKEDLRFLIGKETGYVQYIPNTSKEHTWLNAQTIEANRIQAYRDNAQKELAEWIRFSSKDAKEYCDGLTTASMEIEGIPAWILRNFYGETSVMKKSFREQTIDKVKKQVSQSAGWILITSKDNNTPTLLETGRRMQRLFLQVRERNIAIHPMTQILEEPATAQLVSSAVGITDPIQFVLRTGYVKEYPDPVSLRRPVDNIIRT
jgi:nitroreductase